MVATVPAADRGDCARAGCDEDFTFIDKPKKCPPQPILLGSLKSAGIVKRSHEFFFNGTHVVDHGEKLRTITPYGVNRCITLSSSVVDLCSAKNTEESFCWVLQTTCLALYEIDSEGNSTQRYELALGDNSAVKIEAEVVEGVHHVTILLASGHVHAVNFEKHTFLEEGHVTLDWATEVTAENITSVMESAKDISLSPEGKALAVLQNGGCVTTLKTADHSTMCRFTTNNDVSRVRLAQGVVEANVMKSHIVLALSTVDKETVISTYHVKSGADAKWQAWRTQSITIPSAEVTTLFELAPTGDVYCVAAAHVLYVMHLLPTKKHGKVVRNIASFDCDKVLGGFVSVAAKAEEGGVRVSARRTEGLVMHDIGFGELTRPTRTEKSYTVDELLQTVRRLEDENSKLKEDNAALSRRSNSHSTDFEHQLKATMGTVGETCKEMTRFQQDAMARLTRLDETLKRNDETHRAAAADVQKHLKRANEQAVSVIRESAQKDETELRSIHLATAQSLKKLQEEVEAMMKRVATDSAEKREGEVKKLFEGLEGVTHSLLSEPGLLRLKDMVTTVGFPSPIAQGTQEALKKTLEESMEKSLQGYLEDTARFLIKTESDTLNKHALMLTTKADTMISGLGGEIAKEVQLGMNKLEEDGPPMQKWHEKATAELQVLINYGREVFKKAGSETIDATIELLGRKRMLKRCLDSEQMWTEGVMTIMGGGDKQREQLLKCLVEWTTVAPSFPAHNDMPAEYVTKMAKLLAEHFDDSANNDSRMSYVCSIILHYRTQNSAGSNLRDAITSIQKYPHLRQHPTYINLTNILQEKSVKR